MCSILNAMNQLKLNLDDSQSVTLSSESDPVEWCYFLNFFAPLAAYVAVLAVMVLITLIILKYVTDFSDESSGDQIQEDVRAATESETYPLCSEQVIPLAYGTTCEEDVETGSCSSGEDLYDGRICVICYDEQRNCFFVPCGHCVTCYDCAQRIYDGENNVCPVCRRVIGKSIQIPFALIPLLCLVSKEQIMGTFKIGPVLKIVAWLVAVLVMVMVINGYLLLDFFSSEVTGVMFTSVVCAFTDAYIVFIIYLVSRGFNLSAWRCLSTL